MNNKCEKEYLEQLLKTKRRSNNKRTHTQATMPRNMTHCRAHIYKRLSFVWRFKHCWLIILIHNMVEKCMIGRWIRHYPNFRISQSDRLKYEQKQHFSSLNNLGMSKSNMFGKLKIIQMKFLQTVSIDSE